MSLEALFDPQSVAVIGASRAEGKVGHEILRSLVGGGFEGSIFPVNPKADEIEGLRCYPDLQSIGEAPDLAVIVLPAPAVPQAMSQCAAVGIGKRLHRVGVTPQEILTDTQASRSGGGAPLLIT